jgi:Zn-dependent M28 family amino/carboxypeptidase
MRFLLSLSLGFTLLAADASSIGQQWWKHILFLADDKLEGRNAGSEGHRKAAEYVAAQFRSLGLKPVIQPVPFLTRQIDEAHSSLELLRGSNDAKLTLGKEAILSMRCDPVERVEAPMIFVGYGMKIPEMQYDDLAGLNLRGKIAVMMTNAGPANISGPLRSHAQSAERWKALRAAGAIGTVSIANPKNMDIPWPRLALSRFQVAMDLDEEKLRDNAGQQIAVTVNPEYANLFLEGSGHSFAELLALADSGKQLPRFALPSSIKAHTSVKRGKVESQNVIAVIEGHDAKLKHESVALSAHLDHLGVGEPINGDSINNGAMDNASGVAALIEVARALRPLKRSVVLAVVTGEEKGLLGSKYFAEHPAAGAETIVADFNLDMFLPLHPLKILSVQGIDESTLGADIRAAASEFGVKVMGDMEPQRNLFIRSDQYSFIKKGIPALAFKFGYEKGSPEETLHKEWLKNRYHAPSDDVNQPVDIDGAAKFLQILTHLTMRVADAPERPRWNEASFFKRFAR